MYLSFYCRNKNLFPKYDVLAWFILENPIIFFSFNQKSANNYQIKNIYGLQPGCCQILDEIAMKKIALNDIVFVEQALND